MQELGQYLLERIKMRALIVFLLALTPLMGVPFLSWLGTLIMCFVTLRQGPKAGGLLLLCGLMPGIIFALSAQQPWILVFNVLAGWVFIWLIACVLRQTSSWQQVVQFSVVLGAIAIIIVHFVRPEMSEWWKGFFNTIYEDHITQLKADGVGPEETLQMVNAINLFKQSVWFTVLANIATGFFVALVMASSFVHLAVARWWQALMFNPGGLRQELYSLRFGITPVIFAVGLGVAGWLGLPAAWDALPLFGLVFIVAALTLVHFLAAKPKRGLMILILVYVGIVVFSPTSLIILTLIGLLDCLIDFRKRFRLAVKTR